MRIVLLCALACTVGCTTLSPKTAAPNKALLILGPSIDLVSVDGERKNLESAGLSRNPSVQIEPGPHTLKLRFSALQDVDDENFVKFQSNPVTVQLEARGGDVFLVEHDGPEDISQPDRLSRDVPIRVLKTRSGTGPTSAPAPKKPVVQSVVDATPKPVTVVDPTPPAKPVVADGAAKPAADGVQPLQMLQHWWKQASPNERTSFLIWTGSKQEKHQFEAPQPVY
ncbi:MAG: DUF2057 family protein [Verrucomicrobiota bacterium]